MVTPEIPPAVVAKPEVKEAVESEPGAEVSTPVTAAVVSGPVVAAPVVYCVIIFWIIISSATTHGHPKFTPAIFFNKFFYFFIFFSYIIL